MMNKNKDNQTLTRVELEIMNHLWQINKPASVRELLESYDAPKPAYTTIGTYMKILTQKGFVKPEKHEDDGKTFFFRPLVSHEDYRRRVMSEVKDTFFGAQWFTSLIVLLVYIVWNSLPFKILILLSALQSIDKQYYQAAQIDGTSKFRIFSKITVPLLSPQIFYLLITSFIGAFKEYTSVVAIFGANAQSIGQENNMATVVWYIYSYIKGSNATSPGAMGYAAAGAVILFIIIMIFTGIQNLISKKKVHF